MWEGLARTRRQDRVLHGSAKAANVVFGLIAMPLWSVGQLLGGPLRDLLARLERRGPGRAAARAAAERALDGGADGGPRGAAAGPAAPTRWPSSASGWATSPTSCSPSSARARCSATATRPSSRTTSSRAPTASGSPPRSRSRRRPGPGLIVVHGLFTSSRFDYVRQIAVRAYYEWGFNVAAIDLRSFGMTELTSTAPSTAGWKEGEDIARAGPLPEGAGRDQRRAARDLARRQLRPQRLATSTAPRSCSTAASSRSRRRRCPRTVWARLSEPVPRRPPPLPAAPRLQGGADLAGALGALAAGGRGHGARARARLGAVLRGRAPRRSGAAPPGATTCPTPRCRCWCCIPRTTRSSRSTRRACWSERPPDNDLVRVWILPAGQHGLLEAATGTGPTPSTAAFFERWGDLRGAAAPSRPMAAPRWFTPLRRPGSAIRRATWTATS